MSGYRHMRLNARHYGNPQRRQMFYLFMGMVLLSGWGEWLVVEWLVFLFRFVLLFESGTILTLRREFCRHEFIMCTCTCCLCMRMLLL